MKRFYTGGQNSVAQRSQQSETNPAFGILEKGEKVSIESEVINNDRARQTNRQSYNNYEN